ncbi:choline transporter-like protein [Achlya hypogyna]|uniref:Choline transporter-like protein n=1 Tax=Achlya hypogyna TaxID=1202772 RepID=A0A1V9YMM3_ACHHY|nr:choline transporter-like protein [Achlya hypogyna]
MPTYGAGQPLLHTRRNAYTEADRKCRDVFCVLLFALFWFGMVIVASTAYQAGNPHALIYPADHNGDLCNVTHPDLYFPHPQQDEKAHSTYYGVCVTSCPQKDDTVGGYPAPMDFKAVLHHCVPTNTSDAATEKTYERIFGPVATVFKDLARYVADVRRSFKAVVGIGVGGGFAGCLLWLALLRSVPHVVVWGSVLLSLLLLLVATAVCASEAKLISNAEVGALASSIKLHVVSDNAQYFKIATVALLLIDIVYILLLAFMRSRIQMSIGIVKVACTGLSQIPTLIFFPLLPGLKLLALFVYFVVSSVYIASCGNISMSQVARHTSAVKGNGTNPDVMKYLFAYNVFGVFWTQQLIEAVTVCTIAGAISRYYWSDRDNRHNIGWAVGTSSYYCFRYHFGSLVFGAAIVAAVQFVRALLEYVDRQTQGTQNKAVQIVVCCCRCCLWCLHKVVKFLSSNGYILIAMKGGSFCHAIVDAFNLVAANLGRIGTQSLVATYVLLLGKILVTTGCTLGMYAYETANDIKLSSPFPPLVATGVLSYAIASIFLSVFDVAVNTVLLSICEDEKINRTTGQYYATPEIRRFLDDSAKHAFKHYKTDNQDTSV